MWYLEFVEELIKKNPNEQKYMKLALFASVQVQDFKRQNEYSLLLFQKTGNYMYYYARVLALFFCAKYQGNQMMMQLAEGLMKKAADGKKVAKMQDLELYLYLLEQEGKFQEMASVLSPDAELIVPSAAEKREIEARRNTSPQNAPAERPPAPSTPTPTPSAAEATAREGTCVGDLFTPRDEKAGEYARVLLRGKEYVRALHQYEALLTEWKTFNWLHVVGLFDAYFALDAGQQRAELAGVERTLAELHRLGEATRDRCPFLADIEFEYRRYAAKQSADVAKMADGIVAFAARYYKKPSSAVDLREYLHCAGTALGAAGAAALSRRLADTVAPLARTEQEAVRALSFTLFCERLLGVQDGLGAGERARRTRELSERYVEFVTKNPLLEADADDLLLAIHALLLDTYEETRAPQPLLASLSLLAYAIRKQDADSTATALATAAKIPPSVAECERLTQAGGEGTGGEGRGKRHDAPAEPKVTTPPSAAASVRFCVLDACVLLNLPGEVMAQLGSKQLGIRSFLAESVAPFVLDTLVSNGCALHGRRDKSPQKETIETAFERLHEENVVGFSGFVARALTEACYTRVPELAAFSRKLAASLHKAVFDVENVLEQFYALDAAQRIRSTAKQERKETYPSVFRAFFAERRLDLERIFAVEDDARLVCLKDRAAPLGHLLASATRARTAFAALPAGCSAQACTGDHADRGVYTLEKRVLRFVSALCGGADHGALAAASEGVAACCRLLEAGHEAGTQGFNLALWRCYALLTGLVAALLVPPADAGSAAAATGKGAELAQALDALDARLGEQPTVAQPPCFVALANFAYVAKACLVCADAAVVAPPKRKHKKAPTPEQLAKVLFASRHIHSRFFPFPFSFFFFLSFSLLFSFLFLFPLSLSFSGGAS